MLRSAVLCLQCYAMVGEEARTHEMQPGGTTPDAAQDLLVWCLQGEPEGRPKSMEEVLNLFDFCLEVRVGG